MSPINQKIVELIAKGKADKEIAEELHKKKKTVSIAISRMLKKYNCNNRTQLVVTILPRLTEDSI